MPKLLHIRQAEAHARAEARAKRTPDQQLKLLDKRGGKSARERSRLNDLLVIKAAESTKLVTRDNEAPKPKKKARAKSKA